VDTDAPAETVVRPSKIVLSPDDPLGDAARAAIAQGVEALKQMRAGATAGDVESLHQLRVATRRLRAAIELFAGVLHGSRVRVYKRDLPWLGQAAGMVRECDVAGELIRARSAKLDPQMAEALTPIYDALAERRKAEHQAFLAVTNSKRYVLLLERLSQPMIRKVDAGTTVRGKGAVMIRPIARSVVRAGSKLAEDSPPEWFHSLRVRVKRLRYALEMLTPLGGKRHKKALARLEATQDILGLYQDGIATVAWLRSHCDSGVVPPATLLAAGALIQSLLKRQRKLAARCLKRWKRVERSGIIREATAEIGRRAHIAPVPTLEVVDAA
jgi:CHAD domain-containing protein